MIYYPRVINFTWWFRSFVSSKDYTMEHKQKIVIQTINLLAILGFILSLGSISCFIVMNIVNGSSTSIETMYWQRLFVSKVTYFLIIPGISLIVVCAFIRSLGLKKLRTHWWLTIVKVMIILIVINTINITFIANKVTQLAILQHQTTTLIPEISSLKGKEDMFGGINMLMLLICLVTGCYLHDKD